MEVSAASPLEKEPHLPIVQESDWDLELVWTLKRTEKYFAPTRNRTQSPRSSNPQPSCDTNCNVPAPYVSNYLPYNRCYIPQDRNLGNTRLSVLNSYTIEGRFNCRRPLSSFRSTEEIIRIQSLVMPSIPKLHLHTH
jgi:hypothetical protein